ncbi:MAG: hypothetical protein NTY00_09400 [Deltaproteobacteria bacterium]|nr:hypothetical protein [Deltaproteobacteria bacterium]
MQIDEMGETGEIGYDRKPVCFWGADDEGGEFVAADNRDYSSGYSRPQKGVLCQKQATR